MKGALWVIGDPLHSTKGMNQFILQWSHRHWLTIVRGQPRRCTVRQSANHVGHWVLLVIWALDRGQRRGQVCTNDVPAMWRCRGGTGQWPGVPSPNGVCRMMWRSYGFPSVSGGPHVSCVCVTGDAGSCPLDVRHGGAGQWTGVRVTNGVCRRM